MLTSRRSLITGLVSFIAAPAIVRAGSLMPVKVMKPLLIYDNRVIRHYTDIEAIRGQNFLLLAQDWREVIRCAIIEKDTL